MSLCLIVFLCKQKTAYEMRISDWSSDVCSSDLHAGWIIMALIAVGGIAAYIGLRSPLMIRALEVAIDTPSQGSSALWLTVKNRSRTKIEGVQTHLTRVEPEVPA